MAHNYNNDGVFQGVISGMFDSIGQGLLDKQKEDRDRADSDKKSRMNILQHALDSGKLDDASTQSAFSQLLELTQPSKGSKKQNAAIGQSISAALAPIQAIRGLFKSQSSGSQLPQAATRQQASTSPDSQGSQLPAAPLRMKTQTESQAEEDEQNRHKAQIESDVKSDAEKKQREQMSEEQEQEVDRKMKLFEKYYGKAPDQIQKERIIDQVIGVKATAARAPFFLGEVKGSDYDEATRQQFGLDSTKNYRHYQEPETGADRFEVVSKKPTASEQKLTDEMEEIKASNPKFANASDDDLKKEALTQRAGKRRLQIINLQESAAGKALNNQVKTDLQNGKVTPASARAALASTLQTAKVLNADPTSEWFMKGVDVIQKSLLGEAGFDYTELLKVSGGGGSGSAVKPKTQTDSDPLGILGPKP